MALQRREVNVEIEAGKMAASDAQLNPELTGFPLGYEPDHSRDSWKPAPHEQFHDGPVGGDDSRHCPPARCRTRDRGLAGC